MGIANAVVTNETPQRLAEHFSEYFTRIMVDAPCSGEGMFRKNEEACEQWSTQNVELCAHRQDEILDCAASMLAGGGDWSIRPARSHRRRMREASGDSWRDIRNSTWRRCRLRRECRTDWENFPRRSVCGPHKLRGEGHYVAVLRKEGTLADGGSGLLKNGYENGITAGDSKSAAGGHPGISGICRGDFRRGRIGEVCRAGVPLSEIWRAALPDPGGHAVGKRS